MKTSRNILTLAVLAMTCLCTHAQSLSDRYTKDIRAELGIMAQVNRDWEAATIQAYYTRNFIGRFAYRIGFQYAAGTDEAGISSMTGIPVAIAYRPGTMSVASSLANAAGLSVYDVVRDGYYGETDRIGSDILTNFVMSLFRKSEYYIGVTPGFYPERKFMLTADAGFSLAIPIWRFGIHITPAYHYCLLNPFADSEQPSRHLFSMTAGLSFAF